MISDQLLDESEILTTCAIRFDGYKYQEESGLLYEQVIAEFWASGKWHNSITDLQATFSLLQRALCKWHLVYEPYDGKYWRAYRSLFLAVCEAEIPEKYKLAEAKYWFEIWEKEYKPHLTEVKRFIKDIHESIVYDDDAPPQI